MSDTKIYTKTYVCVEPQGNDCLAWQQTNLGHISPQMAGIIIFYAFILNLVVYGFRTMRRQL